MKYLISPLWAYPPYSSPLPQPSQQLILRKRPSQAAASGVWSTHSTRFQALFQLHPATLEVKNQNPTYKEVSAGGTGHAESVQVVYDPTKVTYEKLLNVFWHNIDPTVRDRQFCDTGHQYRSAIFYHNEEQKRLAIQSMETLEKSNPFKEPIVTEIVQATEFYPAEDYHQHYYKKNPIRYKYYRGRCGRDQRLRELWGSASGH